jgi:hypothetical protein
MDMNETDSDEAVDLLAWWLTNVDALIDPGEVQRRTQVARRLTETGSERAALVLSGMLAALVLRLPDDDPWLDSGEQQYNFLDVDLNLEGLPPLVYTLLISDSLVLESDARHIIHLAKMGGWRFVHDHLVRLPESDRFGVAASAIRHALRRGRMYIDDPRLYEVFAFLGAAERVNHAAFDRFIYQVSIPTGLYPVLAIPGVNTDPPF